MNFLSNLWSGIKDTFSTKTANATSSTPISGATSIPSSTPIPSTSTPVPGSYYSTPVSSSSTKASQIPASYYSTLSTPIVPNSTPIPNSTSMSSYSSGVRPSSAYSSSASPIPLMQNAGNVGDYQTMSIPVPTAASSGYTGTYSAANLSTPIKPYAATSGSSGLSGLESKQLSGLASNGASMASTIPTVYSTEEEKKKNKEQKVGPTQTYSATVPQAGNTPAVQTGVPSTTFYAGVSKQIADAASVTAAQKLTELMKNPNVNLTPDKFNEMYRAEVDRLVQQKGITEPIPDKPIVPTPEQQQLEDAFPDLKSAMDGFREKVGLPDLEKTRIEILKKADALNEVFNKIVDDIRNNPELPASLAQRRIEEFTRVNGTNLKSLQGQLDIVSQQIKDANDAVDREFKIYSDEVNTKRQASQQSQQYAYSRSAAYPDAGILPTDTPEMVNAKILASNSYKLETNNKQATLDNREALINSRELNLSSSEKELARQLAVTKATNTLGSNTGTDGYVDPQVYKQLRADWFTSFGNTSGFDDLFASRVNPADKNSIFGSAKPNDTSRTGWAN